MLAFLLLAGIVCAQDLTDVLVETVGEGYVFAEGPVWSRGGYLIFSDAPRNKLLELKPSQHPAVFRDNSNGAMGNTFDAEGRLYTCETHLRRVTRTDKKGKIEVLAERWQDKRLNAPNDIVVRHDGQVYFTDPAFGNQQDTRELDFYGVFHIKTGGEIEAVARWKTRPRGLALSPNGRLLYVADSDARSIHVFDLAGNGTASNERVFIDKVDGVPGGMRTDEKGNLYVAAKYVYVYSPRGEVLKDIQLAQTPSNLAFGDPDLSSLYVTARTAIYRLRLGVKGALPYAPQVP